MTPAKPSDLLLAVLGVQLGYLTADDVLAVGSDLLRGGASPPLGELLVARGVLDRARRQVLERLCARAVEATGGDATRTLELLPEQARRLALESTEPRARSSERAQDAQSGEHPRMSPPMGTRAVIPSERLCVATEGRYLPAPFVHEPPQELGRGESSRVVLMHDTVLGRELAMKRALGDGDESAAALAAEARLTARLDHPAVVPVYELGRDAEGIFYTMQRVPGRTLAKAITEARTANDRLALLPAFLTVCRCVATAHEAEVAHGALEQDAVMLGSLGEVYVLGWKHGRQSDARTHLNVAEAQRSDLRALAAMLHEVVTGLPVPVMGRVRARGAPPDLLAVVRRGVEGGGFESAQQLVRELQAFLDGRRIASYEYSAAELVRRFVTRNRLFSAIAAGALLVFVGIGVVASQRVRAERDVARTLARRFLDDVGAKLPALPGVEPLLEKVTSAALVHYQRTTELKRAPADERVRVARAMERLGSVSLGLGRVDEGLRSLDFADELVTSVLKSQPRDADAAALAARICLDRVEQITVEADQDHILRAGGECLRLADVALELAPESEFALEVSIDARTRLADYSPISEGERMLDEATALARAALDRSPKSVPAMLLLAEALSSQAFIERVQLQPEAAKRSAERAVELTRQALELAPEDSSVAKKLMLRLNLAGGVHHAFGEAEKAKLELEEARRIGLELLRAQPELVTLDPMLVEIDVTLGDFESAWRRVAALESQGRTGEVAVVVAAVAFLSGRFDEAVRLASNPAWSDESTNVLYRSLACAMLGRPADAVVQARSLRGNAARVAWSKGAVAQVAGAAPDSAGKRAVQELAEAWDAAVPVTDVSKLDAALEQYIAALEAQLDR